MADINLMTVGELVARMRQDADAGNGVSLGSTALRELLALHDEMLGALQHIAQCIPYGGFAQIHHGSSTWAQIDSAITNATER